MFVSKSMTTQVITIDKKDNIFKAKDLMKEYSVRHLPVVDKDNHLIGIITDRSVRSALPSSLVHNFDSQKERDKLSTLTVGDAMTIDPVTISPTYTIQDALLLIQKVKVGAFPVVDENNKLKGIISVRDLLRAFINVLGIGEPGALLCILAEEKVGQLKKIVDAITEENISIGSILVARYWDEGKRAVFPYLLTQNVTLIKKKLEKLGFKLLEPMNWYMDQLPKNE